MADQNSQQGQVPNPSPSAGGFNDPKAIAALTKVYNDNCKRLTFLIGEFFLKEILSGRLDTGNGLQKIHAALKERANKGDKKAVRDALFLSDQISMIEIYRSIYQKGEERKKTAAEKKLAKK